MRQRNANRDQRLSTAGNSNSVVTLLSKPSSLAEAARRARGLAINPIDRTGSRSMIPELSEADRTDLRRLSWEPRASAG